MRLISLVLLWVALLAGCSFPPSTPEERALIQQHIQNLRNSQQQPQIQQTIPYQRPVQTYCSRIGNQVSCTSY